MVLSRMCTRYSTHTINACLSEQEKEEFWLLQILSISAQTATYFPFSRRQTGVKLTSSSNGLSRSMPMCGPAASPPGLQTDHRKGVEEECWRQADQFQANNAVQTYVYVQLPRSGVRAIPVWVSLCINWLGLEFL